MADLLIGADPEFFLKDKDTGKFVSAYGLIPGTKKEPHKVDGGAIQVDGMAVEFNIEPAKTSTEFKDKILSVLGTLRAMIPLNLEFAYVPVADFGSEYIEAQPEVAKMLGCDPDFNAWESGAPNPRPDASASFRTASGHIHIGWTDGMAIDDPEHLDACHMMTKQLDVSLACSALAWDTDTIRRQLYGKAGAYRPKPYGVEYRVLSNAWLNDARDIMYVFNAAKHAFDKLIAGKQYYRDYDDGQIEDIVNYGDAYRAFSAYKYYAYKNDRIGTKLFQLLSDEMKDAVVPVIVKW